MLKRLFFNNKKNHYLQYITIYITAYIRRSNLKKLIESLKGLPVKIVICDSSPDEWEDKNNFNWIEYKHSPNQLLYKVLFDAAKTCKTPYLIWNNDDDMINIKGLKNSIECIHNEKRYSSVTGRLRKKRSNYGKKEFYNWRKSFNYISSDPIERINNMFECFHTPVHDVMRKECLEKSCEIVLNNCDFYPIRFFDRIVGMVQAIYGSKKVINHTLLERSKNQSKKKKEYKRLLEWEDYPTVLEREKKPSEMLIALQKNDPFSSLLVELYGGNFDFYNSNIMKILKDYYSKIEKKN